MLLYILFSTALVAECIDVDPSCDYQQDLILGQEYYIYNKEYPWNYPNSTSCRWSARSPYGTIVVLSCLDVDIPMSQYCQDDKLLVSFSGDENFRDARTYCGMKTFTVSSQRNFLTVGLFSSSTTPGGRFVCSLAAMRFAPQGCTCSLQKRPEETKIVGGQETIVNEFPWMAVIVDAPTGNAFCGADIISDRYVLTAAHCLLNRRVENLRLLAGGHALSAANDTSTAALYRISTVTTHRYYNPQDESNDIAVLQTTNTINFNNAVGPVCLPFIYGTRLFVDDLVTVLGWGFRDVSGSKSDTLQEANLTVVSNDYCYQRLEQTIDTTQMCTYAPGRDACLSDSGGPLLWNDGSRYYLVGIISFGISCATNVPGVNTRVTSFLSWIASVTSDNSYCNK